MTLLLLAYLGGVLTIVSPCILPVLPFVFARAGQPFLRGTLPMLIGMAAAFAGVATLAAVGGHWAVEANQYGRIAAMALLALFGLALLLPALANRVARPLVALGGRLTEAAERHGGGAGAILPSLLLGIATGLLWAPCAGPILGLILTGAALQGANIGTSLLLLAYAAGAATSLAVALLAGGKVFALMKRSLGAGEWLRRTGGVAVLAAVGAIALGLDTGVLTQLSLAGTNALEQRLLDRFDTAATPPPAPAMMSGSAAMTGANPAMMSANPAMMAAKPAGADTALPVEGALPSLAGAVTWLNSPPLSSEALKGKVVLVDFWTYSCINCLRAIPYVRAWAEKYKDQGLVVIGVHTPEFAFEKRIDNVKQAAAGLKIGYPLAIDNDYAIWRAFANRYWPAHYFIDAQGRIRHHHFGEGGYEQSEKVIQQLLAEAGRKDVATGTVSVTASGAEMASDEADVRSPETYLGYERAENFVSPGGAVEDASQRYEPGMPRLNEWGLSGQWTIGKEHAALDAADGAIAYRFHARDLHLVLGPGAEGAPIRFRVTIDGAAPGPDHGVDIDADGNGTVTGQRLYQLIRQGGPVKDRSFEIRFLDAGAQAYAFTFG
ncbi:cytochrome c biogenesis protein DipZ [Bosea sp. (in: a-proteobacteria)]|uniref:cytochrome c biogenesis protein DipZ n=1 Tax=Bosea sp. (in: a-proteobacteria) TaxID=1871050 RepID=UPI002616E878|nr:cytochrome c biogenesis protein DipZ [Bosea sp. (in: a-proteobacteria)]MCO5092976.1 cytochrome c biogenesis protein DipZ [Bosea sp. (in: a-proteobacteria)]